MRRFLVSFLAIVLLACPAPAAEHFFVIFFGAQDGANRPRHSHTWATFARAEVDDATPDAPGKVVESFTISWLPASADVRLLARPEPGRNFTLQESLAWAAQVGSAVTTWGPFELTRQGYELAGQQKARLDSGGVLYKALDERFRPGAATNCIHAVTDIVPTGLVRTGQTRGNGGTVVAVEHFQPLLVHPEKTHPWVSSALGLPAAPVPVTK